ncbi:MAG: cytochrome c [Woeseiaceae bacterium]|nr:cytochrome c [Woeseiaceae bacterium]
MKLKLPIFLAVMAVATSAFADDDPRHVRHELMEGVRDAAKPVGLMLRGEAEFDSEQLMQSLNVWKDAAAKFGDLFPEGTETGMDTEAAPAIWTDREGFDAALAKWAAAVDTAIAAAPDSLEAARPVVGAAFQNCKACHDNYRISDD